MIFGGAEFSFFCIGIGTDGLFASLNLNAPNLSFEEVSDPPETLFSRRKESSLSKD